MRTATRLGLFAAGAAAVFVVAFGAARVIIPAEASAAWTSDTTEDTMQSHDTASSAHDTAASDDVRGLSVSHAGYRLTELTAPDAAGASGELSFTLLGPDGEPLTDYDTAHEQDLHLIVVRTTAPSSATCTRRATAPAPGRSRGVGRPPAPTASSPTSCRPPSATP